MRRGTLDQRRPVIYLLAGFVHIYAYTAYIESEGEGCVYILRGRGRVRDTQIDTYIYAYKHACILSLPFFHLSGGGTSVGRTSSPFAA